MNFVFILFTLIPLISCSNDDITLNLGDKRQSNVDISYYMSRLYLTPKNSDENENTVTEIKWNELFKFKIRRPYSLIYVVLKPIGNMLLELKIKLLEIGSEEFIEHVNVIKFPDDYHFPNWLTLESPQFTNHITRSMIDIDMETLQGDIKMTDQKDHIKIRVNNTSFISKLTWSIFFSTNVIDLIFADTIKLIGIGYRKIKMIAYSSLIPNVVHHLTTITFPDDYHFPFWFSMVNGCFFKLIMNKPKTLHFGVLSHRSEVELVVHRHVNLFHIYVNPEYFECVAIKGVSLYTFSYFMPPEFDYISDIFIKKQIEQVEFSLALSKKDNPLKKITINLPYSNEIKTDWESILDTKITSSDDLIALNLDLSSPYLPIQIQMVREMNNYTLEPTFNRISRIISVSKGDTFYHLVKATGEINKVIISYLPGDAGRMKIEAKDMEQDTRFEKWFLFNEKKFANFINHEPSMPGLGTS